MIVVQLCGGAWANARVLVGPAWGWFNGLALCGVWVLLSSAAQPLLSMLSTYNQ